DDDRRLGRQQSALRLVHGARDSVESRGQMDDRSAAEPLVPLPAWWLGECEVDLHLASAEAELPSRTGHLLGNDVRFEQTPIELCGCDVAHHGTLRGDGFS